jgi:hypothetical protein
MSQYDDYQEEEARPLTPEERWQQMHQQNDPLLARLGELHQEIYQKHLLEPKELEKLEREREHYLQQAGKFQAWDFLGAMGFAVKECTLPGYRGDRMGTLTIEGMEVNVLQGYGQPKDKLSLILRKPGESKDVDLAVTLPSSPDELYKALDRLKLSTLTWHRKRAQFETSYIKSKRK